MHEASGSWQVREGGPSSLVVPLIVRQLLGAPEFDGRALPLLPNVDQVSSLPRRLAESIHAEWEHWWATEVERDADGHLAPIAGRAEPPPVDGAELGAFLRSQWTSIRAGAGEAEAASRTRPPTHDMTINTLMKAITDELGRPPKPFRFYFDLAPFTLPGLWQVSSYRVLIDDGFRPDASAFGEAIRPILLAVS